MLIKGIASRLNIRWALADKWAKTCSTLLTRGNKRRDVPIWAQQHKGALGSTEYYDSIKATAERSISAEKQRTRFVEVRRLFSRWAVARGKLVATSIYQKMPQIVQAYIQSRLVNIAMESADRDNEEI